MVYIIFFVGYIPGGFAQAPALSDCDSQEDRFTSEITQAIFASQGEVKSEALTDFEQSFSKNLAQLRKKLRRSTNDQQALRHVFYALHRKSLKRYEQYTSFAEMAESGRYDCLTASTLYAMYLRALGYQVNIVETQYHMYLKVKIANKEIVLETTDPLEGFISDAEGFAARKSSDLPEGTEGKTGGVSSDQEELSGSEINASVSVRELIGLHYYNQAIAFWNNGEEDAARNAISIAFSYYPSSRIQDLKTLFRESNSVTLMARRK